MIQARYGEKRHGWSRHGRSGLVGCAIWKGVCKGLDDFFRLIKFKVNKGNRVKFWLDAWCLRDPLCVMFLACYNLALSKTGLVQNHLILSRVICSWNI